MKNENIIRAINATDEYIVVLTRMVNDAKASLKSAKTQREVKMTNMFIQEKERDISMALKEKEMYTRLLTH